MRTIPVERDYYPAVFCGGGMIWASEPQADHRLQLCSHGGRALAGMCPKRDVGSLQVRKNENPNTL